MTVVDERKRKDPYEIGFLDAMAIARHEVCLARSQLHRCSEDPSLADVNEILDSMMQSLSNTQIPQSSDFG